MKKLWSCLLILSMLISAAPVFSQKNTGLPAHVIINQVYGGGDPNDRETPVSHSFIELYNPTDVTVSLNGWSVQYSDGGKNWSMLPLSGEISSKHSFLIRCGAHNQNARLKISDYDQSWDITLNNKGLKILLKNNLIKANCSNPFLSSDDGYVDMVGVAGNEYYYLIDGCETDYAQIQSKQKSIRRNNFNDTDVNSKDFSAVDYRTADIDEVRPRSSADGQWTYHQFIRTKKINKTVLNTTDKDFTFLHVSDTQASTEGQFKRWGDLTNSLSENKYDFTIHTGDITDNPDSRSEMDMFYEYSGNLMQKAFIPVVGNHDQKSNTNAELFGEYFGTMPGTQAPYPTAPNTTASFDYGNAHFIILNSEDDLSTQAKWLDSELAKTDKKWKIVALHRSPYGAAGTNDTLIFAPVFDKYHVDLVLHGHDHLYARTEPLYNGQISEGGTVYLESGSSGIKQEIPLIKQSYHAVSISPQAPAYSSINVTDDGIYVTAQALENGVLKTIDSFSIKKYTGTYTAPEASEYSEPVRLFSDIRADRPYRDSVMLLAQLGIIEKTVSFMPNEKIDSGEFNSWLNKASGIPKENPNSDNVTLSYAVNDILDRLGYSVYIENSGADVRMVAKDIGLLSGITLQSDEYLTRSDAVRLIGNALEAYMLKPVSYSDSEAKYAQVYSSWLNTIFDVYKIRGIITDRPYYTASSKKDYVTFVSEYGEEITAGFSEEIYDLLGYEIDAYIRSPYGGGTMLYGIKTKNNSVLTVKKSWYGEIPDTKDYIYFSYTNDSGKSYKIKIDKKAEFIYNGALSETIKQKALNKEKNAFKPSHIGKINFVDYNNDGVYDFVFIDNYKDMFVSGIDSSDCKVINKLEYIEGTSVKKSKYTEIPKIHLDKTDDSYRLTFRTPDEKPSSFSSITKDCVISVALSSTDDENPETALVRRVYISNFSAAGTVTSIYNEDGDDYFVVNGKGYRASKSYYNTYNGGESENFANISIGDSIAFYLDYDERITYISSENTAIQYGILLKQYCDEQSPDTANYIKLVDSAGTEQKYEISKQKYKKYKIESMTFPALIKFQAKNGKIVSLNTTPEQAPGGIMEYCSKTGRAGDYFLNENTLLFLYCGDKYDENSLQSGCYHTITPADLTNKSKYLFDIYDLNDYCIPSAAVVYRNPNTPLNEQDDIMIIRSVNSVINENNEIIQKVYGYSGNTQKELSFSENEKNFPCSGDVIQYRLNSDGDIEKWDKLCDSSSDEFEKNTLFDDIFFAKYNNPINVSRNIITFDLNGKKINHICDSKTTVYNIKKGQAINITPGNINDITKDNTVFIIVKEGIADEIFVWDKN